MENTVSTEIPIDQIEPHCIICMKVLPRKRSSLKKKTCSVECSKLYNRLRIELNNRFRCKLCHHPSTPEERADFIQWRRDRGQIGATPGRPKKNPLKEPLKKAIEILSRELDGILDSNCQKVDGVYDVANCDEAARPAVDELRSAIEEFSLILSAN